MPKFSPRANVPKPPAELLLRLREIGQDVRQLVSGVALALAAGSTVAVSAYALNDPAATMNRFSEGLPALGFEEGLTQPLTDPDRASERFGKSMENLGKLVVDGLNQNRLVGAEASALAAFLLAVGTESPDPPSRNSPGPRGGPGTYGNTPLPERRRKR